MLFRVLVFVPKGIRLRCERGYGVTGLEPLSYGESAMPSKPVSSPESFHVFDLVQSAKSDSGKMNTRELTCTLLP